MKKPIYKDETILLWGVNYTIKEIFYSGHLQEYVYILKNEHDDDTYETIRESEVVRLVGTSESRYNILKRETLEELSLAYDSLEKEYKEMRDIVVKIYNGEQLTKEEFATMKTHAFLRRVGRDEMEDDGKYEN